MAQKREKPVAALIGPEALERIEQRQVDNQEQFWQTVDRIRERNADKNPDEELPFITGVVEEVRQERYDAARRKTEGRR